ncbi:LysM peptidoglycan-binding domain-containing protein [Lactobacillus taiwanensis]|uniref:aggregation-promoting factor n=1 Tax=Lactobacillus taiwanensis TaxID=508451 RepID=UPI00214BB3A3|nr:LysM peptidoglycan-binding domain-containing protein [Lactobacillus taiwanensis]MCR1903911.1 LysM peptidoglycan-binding domain-containing protein [Lactobacillus taiwanensis]
MRLKAKQLLLFLGGSAAAVAAKSATNTQVHADTITVKKGDTTWDIAQNYNKTHQNDKTSVEQIIKDNNLQKEGSLIFVDQKLEVNKDDGTPKKKVSAQTRTKSVTGTNNTRQNTNVQSTPATNNSGKVTQRQAPAAPSTPAVQNQSAASNVQQKSSNYVSNVGGSEQAAKEWIAARESGGSYSARNGRYYGRYQLDTAYLGGDYSPSHQEQVADNYVKNRYGSWQQAQAFWQSNGWY